MSHKALLQRRADAAALRAAGTRQLADRPSHRRQFEAPESLARVSVPLTEVRVTKVSDETVEFDGYASITEEPYEMWDWYGPYDEVVRAGAFIRTLNRSDLDVPLVIAHDQIRRIARTTTGDLHLEEDTRGLHVRATLSLRDLDVQYIVPKLESGHVDEMSFAFRIVKGLWSPDYMQYSLEEVDLHRGDVAIVGFGANPATAGSGLASEHSEVSDERQALPTPKRGVDLISEDDIAPRRA
jgi:HK97 family phage prohead protease